MLSAQKRSAASLALSLLILVFGYPAFGQLPEVLFSGMKWRSIGPYRGGRSVACAGSEARPDEYYFGATGGGLWKTTNGGADWACVSDGFFKTSSVGAIAIAESNPDVVYAGMGERDIRGDISEGDGVYKSMDGGKTWSHVGLEACQTISKIVVDPKNPDRAFVAALGHVYGPHEERGVYRTLDGGKSWKRVLDRNNRTGAVDLCLDPKNPEVLYAAMWEVWRTPFELNSGGPGSGIFKTVNGGETWQEITRSTGLPPGLIGKIGISVSRAQANRIYAIVESADGGIFRSDDGGLSWIKANDDSNWRQRPWYYTHIIADPSEKDTVYALNVGMGKSTDGGKTFASVGTPHSDNHDLWIAPGNPRRMINANDGGANVSTDGGRTWTEQDLPTAQFYHVTTDSAFPYRIYGAQQDNSTVRIASRGSGAGIGRSDWTSTAGGESGYIAVHPKDPEIVFGGSYGGDLSMLNHRTGERRSIDVWPDNPMGHGAIDLVERFQWTFPIVFSPHEPSTLYTCSQHLFQSTNSGQTWKRISPDLTRNDPGTLGSSGGPITKDNTSVEYYGTIFTFAESRVNPGVFWTGSDDGLVHLSRDAGASWQNITPKGMPNWGLCSMIEDSPHDAGTAYLAVDNHENDDLTPYMYRTTNFGQSWSLITKGIPNGSFVRVVREDPIKEGLLFAGTERGCFVSFDKGQQWQPFQGNLPVTPIHDLTIKNGDLIAATHGRSFWVLDDISPLRHMTSASHSAPVLFPPRDAFRTRGGGGFGGRSQSGRENLGENPPSGIVLSYFLPESSPNFSIEVFDEEGTKVGAAASPGVKGFHRAAVRLNYPSYRGFPGMVLWNGSGGQIPAPPGTYTVRMMVGDLKSSRPLSYRNDPRFSATDADLQEQTRFARKIAAKVQQANDAVVRIREVKKALLQLGEKEPRHKQKADALQSQLTDIEGQVYQYKSKSGQDPLNYPIQLNDKLSGVLGVVLGSDFRPTDQSYEVFQRLAAQLDLQLAGLEKLMNEQVQPLLGTK